MASQYYGEAKRLGRAFRLHDIYTIDNILEDKDFLNGLPLEDGQVYFT